MTVFRSLLIGCLFLVAGYSQPNETTNQAAAFPGEITLPDGSKLKGDITQGKQRTRVINPYLGTFIVSNDFVKQVRDLSPKKEPEIISARIPTGTNLADEDAMTAELAHFAALSIAKLKLTGVSNIAVREVIIDGMYDINDKAFEASLLRELSALTACSFMERQALSILLEEQALGAAGLTENDLSGKLQGVDALISVKLNANDKRTIEGDFKLTHVERGTSLLKKKLKYVHEGNVKFGFALLSGTPRNFKMTMTHDEVHGSRLSNMTIKGSSGQSAGFSIFLAQRLDKAKFFEIGLRGNFEKYISKASKELSAESFFNYQSSYINQITWKGANCSFASGSAEFKLNLSRLTKKSESKWFALVNLGIASAGISTTTETLEYSTNYVKLGVTKKASQMNIMATGFLLSGGFEFFPTHALSIMAEAVYLPDAKGVNGTQNLVGTIDDFTARLALRWYLAR